MNKFKIGILIYTYNRIDDAKINMEIIRNIWGKSKLFSNIKIVHCYNGLKNWYPKKYLEDDLIRLKNTGHFQGASELIDAGIEKFIKKYNNLDYVIVLASDTWNVKPEYIHNLLMDLKNEAKYLATCAWGLPNRNDIIKDVGIAVDYFILDLKWAKKYKMFPVNYKEFYKKFSDLLYFEGKAVMFEKLMLVKFVKAIHKQFKDDVSLKHLSMSKIMIMKDRMPVHSHINKKGYWIRNMYWPKMGLLTHHNPRPKKEILKKLKITEGKNVKKLLNSKKLGYFNKSVINFKNYN